MPPLGVWGEENQSLFCVSPWLMCTVSVLGTPGLQPAPHFSMSSVLQEGEWAQKGPECGIMLEGSFHDNRDSREGSTSKENWPLLAI